MAEQRTPSIQTCLPQDLVEPVAERVGRAVDENVVQRIWARDASLWDRATVAEADAGMGWLTLPETMRAQAPMLRSFAQECWADGFTDAVVLATGGAALGTEVLRRTLAPAADGLTVRVLDTTHPDAVLAVEESLDLARTLFVVSSKSGETVETVSHYKHFSALAPPERFVAVTDPGSALAGLAQRHGFRRLFLNRPDIAGPHSVLSVSGLLPAALMGVDIDTLLDSAQAGAEECAQHAAGNANPGLWLGAVAGELAAAGRDKLTFVVPPPIDSFGLWVEQLIATSCGKRGRGIVPVADEPFAAPEAYASDRVITYVRDIEQPLADFDEEVQRLSDAGQPTLTLPSSGTADLGRLFFVSQFAVAVAAWAIGVNPFERPDALEPWDATRKVLESSAPAQVPRASDEDLRALLAGAGPPNYVAVLGFLPPSDRVDEAVAELRGVIRSAIRTAVTFGYGPRYLHATGQLHKGGPPSGRFLQLIARPRRDAEIPGARYSYARLVTAQVAGDHQDLRAHGLPVVPVELDGDAATAVRELTERVSGLLGT
ncbi:MAG: glucose-6-phosphate isomerase [Solirubrobacteraceae bacterium]